MKFVLVSYGTRGDVEPCVVIGRELMNRGHHVLLGVPPDLVSFVECAGIAAVSYGLDTRDPVQAVRDFFAVCTRSYWRLPLLAGLWRDLFAPVEQCWSEMGNTLLDVAGEADVLLTTQSFQEPVANVAEYYDIPLATLHLFPVRPNGHLVPGVPSWLLRTMVRLNDWLQWRLTKRFDDAQRQKLGLANAAKPGPQRIAERGAIEIQAYDPIWFGGLLAEWSRWKDQRPFVGAMTLGLPTDADDEVKRWIADGTPPIFFGFGSIPVESPRATVEMIGDACSQLGERALICAGWSDFRNIPQVEHVKLVRAVDYATIFPLCKAVVHSGGAGTTPIGVRAGVPTLALWTLPEQSYYGAQLKALNIGCSRRLSRVTAESLVLDLRRILTPEYRVTPEIADLVTEPGVSAVKAADLLEALAR